MRITLLSVMSAGLLATSGTALAQTPASDAYGGSGSVPGTVIAPEAAEVTPGEAGEAPAVLGAIEAGEAPTVAGATATSPPAGAAPATAAGPTAVARPTATSAAPSGSLPFTGFDLTLIALGGLVLIGIGFGARRLTRPVA